jgi:hypothetical protein
MWAMADPGKRYQFDAFISYANNVDYVHARSLEAFLESVHRTVADSRFRQLQICRDGSDFRIPRRDISQEAKMPDDIWHIVQEHLEQCEKMIVLCSPEAAASPWVRRELEWFLAERGHDAVLPAVTIGDPSLSPRTVFPEPPLALGLQENMIWYDLRDFASPVRFFRDYKDERARLAADLSTWGDHRTDFLPVWKRADRNRALWRGATITALLLLVVGVVFAMSSLIDARSRLALYDDLARARVSIGIDGDDSYLIEVSDETSAPALQHLLPRLPELGAVSRVDLDQSEIDDDALLALRSLSGSLETLWLDGTTIGLRGLRVLNDLPMLTSLTLREASIDDDVIPALTMAARLERLDLRSTAVGDETLQAVAGIDTLKELWVDETRVSREAVQQVRDARPALEIHADF